MELTSQLAHYVIQYYRRFMTTTEKEAYRHLRMKWKVDGAAASGPKFLVWEKRLARYLSKDPPVLELAKDGLEEFIQKTAERIVKDHADEVRFNYCPKCGQMARTAYAKQCRFCYHDWH